MAEQVFRCSVNACFMLSKASEGLHIEAVIQ